MALQSPLERQHVPFAGSLPRVHSVYTLSRFPRDGVAPAGMSSPLPTGPCACVTGGAPTEALGKCPAPLFHKLVVNGFMPDEAANRTGNCGIDAFARSLMAQMRLRGGVTRSEGAKNRRTVQNAADKIRRVGVSWLEASAEEVIWPGMTVAKLCTTVSGCSFREYVDKMKTHLAWRTM